MSEIKKVLLLYSDVQPVNAGVALDLSRLSDALIARGAVVEEFSLDSDPSLLLDQLQEGVVTVLFRGDRNA